MLLGSNICIHISIIQVRKRSVPCRSLKKNKDRAFIVEIRDRHEGSEKFIKEENVVGRIMTIQRYQHPNLSNLFLFLKEF